MAEGTNKPPTVKVLEEKPSFSNLKKITPSTLQSEAIKLAWKSVRDIVALKLMGNRGCPVPHLTEATQYALLNVLVKEKQPIIGKMIQRPPTVHWSAPLENLLPATVSLKDFQEAHKIDMIDEDSKDFLQYHLKNSDQGSKGEKERQLCDVEVQLFNVQHYKVDGATTETPVAKNNADLQNVARIYLVTEVYIAKSMIMNVRVRTMAGTEVIREDKFQWNSQSMLPIGFVFRKCELRKDGVLEYNEEVERTKAIGYHWVEANEK